MWAIEEQRQGDEERMALLMHRLEVLRADGKAGAGANSLRTVRSAAWCVWSRMLC